MNNANQTHIIPHERWWWVGLALILLVGAFLYYRGYDSSLPYIDHPDEPAFNLAAQTIIDSGSARQIRFDAYPPGIITLNYLFVKYLKPEGAHYASVLPSLRLLTVTVWMLAIVMVALIAAKLAHPLTGLMAGAIWTVNPWVVERVRYALPDGYVTFFTLLSLWLVLVGVMHYRRNFSTGAIFSIMLAIVFKTQAIFIVPIIWAVPLVNLYRHKDKRGDTLRQVFWNGVRFAVFLAWLLLLYPTLEANRIPYWVAPTDDLAIPSVQTLWSNLNPVLLTFQSLAGWGAMIVLGGVLMRYHKRVNLIGIVTIGLAGFAWLVGVSLFGVQSIRQFFVLGALLAILYGVALTAILFVVQDILSRLNGSAILREVVPPAVLMILLVIALVPAFTQSNAIAHDFSLPDRRNDLAQYMDTSLEPALHLTTFETHKVMNRQWGGYDGLHEFPRYPQDALLSDKPIKEWRELGIVYAIMPEHMLDIDPDIYYPDETTLLKRYPVSDEYRGPDMLVLRLYPIQHQAEGQLGSISLVGYDISATDAQPDETIHFRLYWQATAPTDAPQRVFNHLLDENGDLVAQVDGVPLFDDRRDTTTWDDPDEILVSREFSLPLPSDLADGTYTLISGFYDADSGVRLLDADNNDALTITTIAINTE